MTTPGPCAQSLAEFDVLGDPNAALGGFWIVNLTAYITARNGKHTAEFFVKSATNKR